MNHNHTEPQICQHELKYCKKCDVVYCEKCQKEWSINFFTYTSPIQLPLQPYPCITCDPYGNC